jgi:hypothetical protein
MARGSERPDATKVVKHHATLDKKWKHLRRSLPGEQCGHHESAIVDHYGS